MKLFPTLILSLVSLTGCVSPPLQLPADHPANAAAVEGPPVTRSLRSDEETDRTRELLARRPQEAANPDQ